MIQEGDIFEVCGEQFKLLKFFYVMDKFFLAIMHGNSRIFTASGGKEILDKYTEDEIINSEARRALVIMLRERAERKRIKEKLLSSIQKMITDKSVSLEDFRKMYVAPFSPLRYYEGDRNI